jgi:transcriptional regulator with XRE-family HTH domain
LCYSRIEPSLEPGSRDFGVPTQEGLGHAAKLHHTHIGFLEQDRREPSLSTLLILAETLEIPARKLIEGLDVPKERRPRRRA